MEQQHFAWPYCPQAQASSSVDSSCNVGGGEQTSGLQVDTDFPHISTAHVLDGQLQELALHLCRQELENSDGLDSEDSTGQLHSCCRSNNYSWDPIMPTMPNLQNVLAEGVQDPVCARLLSTESLSLKALETRSWEALGKGSQVESSNNSFYCIHKSDEKLQTPLAEHDHWAGWITSESNTSLPYGRFFPNELLSSDPLLSQIEIQQSRVKQEVDNADLKRSTLGQDQTSLLQTLHFPQLISNSEAPTRWVTQLPDLLSQIFSSCSTSQSNPLGSRMSRLISEHCIQSPAGSNLSRDNSSSTCMQSHGEAAFNRSLGQISSQIRDSFKENTSCSNFLGNSEPALEPLFKRPRMELNSNFPFKVRKEKLGERITELQQLVSPFGKTDIASVLLEAIGYIKFLHEQVQALSTPYMKSSTMPSLQNHESNTSCWSSETAEDDEEPEHDLRSRGLCLVPLTSTLEVTNENGANYWAPTVAASSR
ncbi:hypothetical protein O6H91_10G060100 [Diphasiastrum complanatum]|uniref:Uncharacterized protein n=1 Tax=Diphasiastrum complanatum TaxID=34168 RepID=A0ACC2CHM3_DIPCM|nr:hypothetical protein O6H91_10G060100 [Diphasiastrum complanatum]